MLIVGNDVVDLLAPRTSGRAGDERFVARVFSDEEREGIQSAADPDLELWHGWAAKEAAYKVVSKLLPEPPVFAHRRFEVTWPSGSAIPAGDGRWGRVRHGTWDLPVRAELDARRRFLHVVALGGRATSSRASTPAEALTAVIRDVEALETRGAPWDDPLEILRSRLTSRERDAVHSLPSAAVRIGARQRIAETLGLAPSRVEISCRPGPLGRRPPGVLVDGSASEVDVSLSHDGPWIAWAFTAPDLDHPS